MVENVLNLFDGADLSGDWSAPLEVLQALFLTQEMDELPDWLAVEMLWMAVCLRQTAHNQQTAQENLEKLKKLKVWKKVVDFDENCALIDEVYLLRQGIALEKSGLTQFLAHPNSKNASPHRLFDVGFYKACIPLASNHHPLVHFFRHSGGHTKSSVNPNPYFCIDGYRKTYLSKQPHRHPLLHYLQNENNLDISPSACFDNHFVKNSLNLSDEIKPFRHYLDQLRQAPTEFFLTGFSPCPFFDRKFYLERHQDIRSAAENGKLDPFHHFCSAGISEGRLGHVWLRHDLFFPEWMPKFKEKKRQAILILGMHRSGTSAITRVVNLLGYDLASHLMEANFANEAGYWESDELAKRYHDPILASFNSAWDDVLPIAETFHHAEDWFRFRAALAHYVVKEFHASDQFVIKDPRICKLLPLWLEALADLGVELKIIIPFRSPIEVAKSLAQRDGFALEKSLLLWLDHVLTAERETRGFARCFVSYQKLLEQPAQVIRQMTGQCGIIWPNDSDATLPEIEAFINPRLCHQRPASVGPDLDSIPAWVTRVYQALELLAENGADLQGMDALEGARSFVMQMNRFIAALLYEKDNRQLGEAQRYRKKHDLIMQHALEIQKLVG